MDQNQVTQLLTRAKKLQQENKLQPAKVIYLQILQQHPNHPDVHHLIGILYNQLNQPEQAIHHLNKAIALNPTVPQAYHNLGIVYRDKEDLEVAIKYYEKALAMNPNYYQVMHKLANAYHRLGKLDKATYYFEKTLLTNPNYAEGWQDYAIYFFSNRQNNKAKQYFEKAIALNPQLATAHLGLGNIYAQINQYETAIQIYKKVLELKPDLHEAYARLLRVYDEICDWQDLSQRRKQLLEITREQLKANVKTSVDPFSALAYYWSAEDLAAIAANYAKDISAQVKPAQTKLNFQFKKNITKSKLKIGYISGSFRNHAITHLTYNLFATHDRKNFEIFAFALVQRENCDYYQHMVATADHFIGLTPYSDVEAAQKIYDNQIDILVDLDGYTGGSRTPIIAMRPAPIQVSYLGFTSTSGANFIDYMVVDDTVITPQTAKTYTEKLIYLPKCYQINNDQQPIATQNLTRQQYNLPEKSFVYCSFNNPYKIEPKIFSIWMEILSKTPDSVLWLFSEAPIVINNLQTAAKKMGINPDRLIFAKPEEKSVHLARHRLADLFLDTHHVNAHTTACDALWAGLPILTCPGNIFISRVGASLLKAIDLPELITPSLQDYADTAVYFYYHQDELQKIRTKLEKNRHTTALFNTKRFVRNLEKAYLTIWENYQSGKQPQVITINEAAETLLTS